ncbi:MAG TPA: DMT family transporter [Chloroflexota bacterium]|nr:DMT family transporter [Chloroflexota bacterium]
MNVVSFGLVLISAFAHATWNYLAKSSRDPYAFTWAFTSLAGLIYLPVALMVSQSWPSWPVIFVVSVTAVLHVFYFGLLNASYRRSDLSLVYPVARGTGLTLIPIGAALLLREHISFPGMVSIGIILGGVLIVHSRGRGWAAFRSLGKSLHEPGSRLAVLTGVVIACYSLWDAHALSTTTPLILDAGIFAGEAVLSAPYALLSRSAAVRREIRERPVAVVGAAILSPLAYLLVLTAITLSPVAYVAPTREIGIVIGALLGWRSLKEGHGSNRLLGSGLIVVGVFSLAFSP